MTYRAIAAVACSGTGAHKLGSADRAGRLNRLVAALRQLFTSPRSRLLAHSCTHAIGRVYLTARWRAPHQRQNERDDH